MPHVSILKHGSRVSAAEVRLVQARSHYSKIKASNRANQILNPQTQTLRLFTILSALRADWAHTLILSFGLNSQGAALALAANIVGATCLSIDPSAEACHDALRSGAVDFSVNTLDEALRALKNEIRQGHPLSVALEAEPAAVLAEALDRGLLPDLFATFPTGADHPDRGTCLHAADAFDRLGVPLLDFDGTLHTVPSALKAAALLDDFTDKHRLTIATFQFSTAAMLREFDTGVLDAIPPEDPRHRWVIAAPRQFHRRVAQPLPYERVLFLTPEERSLLHAPSLESSSL